MFFSHNISTQNEPNFSVSEPGGLWSSKHEKCQSQTRASPARFPLFTPAQHARRGLAAGNKQPVKPGKLEPPQSSILPRDRRRCREMERGIRAASCLTRHLSSQGVPPASASHSQHVGVNRTDFLPIGESTHTSSEFSVGKQRAIDLFQMME